MKTRLLDLLKEYENSDFYPFHMPGHKRDRDRAMAGFCNPALIDITEIDGFDNLHHPEGILKESMEEAAEVYGSDKTYYLVNGSSAGILSAISGCTSFGGRILMARNCHKAAYHGVFLKKLKTSYVYPQKIKELGIQGGILAEDVEKKLKEDQGIEAVFLVSPTYDGIVSDIEAIAKVVHEYHIPLIVDEAHGAHFPFSHVFPASALDLGADVVIQSVHKTLPAFTQSAVLHIKGNLVKKEQVERYLQIYQSSSPSYLLMAGIENSIFWMKEHKKEIETYYERLLEMRERLKHLKNLRLVQEDLKGKYGIFDMDLCKVLISTEKTCMDGAWLGEALRERYHLEMEMAAPGYVTAITSVMDREEGFDRLTEALENIDLELWEAEKAPEDSWEQKKEAEQKMTVGDAMDSEMDVISLKESAGRISGEFIYLYPPGIPMIVPGEVMNQEILEKIEQYHKMGLSVQGLEDESLKTVRAVREKQ